MDTNIQDLSESESYCDCKNLITVSALCGEDPLVVAPDLAALKVSAKKQDGCPFCLLCWNAIVQKHGDYPERWARESFESRGKDNLNGVPRNEWAFGIRVTADFKFQRAVHTTDGRLLKGRKEDRPSKARAIQRRIQSSVDSVIDIEVLQRPVNKTTLRVFALPDTAGALHIRERCSAIDSDPHHKACQDLIQNWMLECESHELCAPDQEHTEMPTRVVDVSSGLNPRVVITGGERGKFMALSYCWGPQGKDLLVLNNDTKSALLEGALQESNFARTHREAFDVARFLGIQYVWIDALCIIQGDSEDWAAESKNMGQVYNNAYLTVLAGSSTDSRAGFLADRHNPSQPFHIPLDDNSRSQPFLCATIPRSHTEGPTSTRGWCFQEAMLSRRLVTFGTEQLSFRCTTGTSFEHTAFTPMDGVPRTLEERKTPVFHPDRQQPRGADLLAQRHAILEHWYVMLVEFTSRRLSNPHDVFASVSSLAQAAARLMSGSRYLAGLWETDLIRGLLWRPSYYGDDKPIVLARPQPSALAPGPGPVVRAPTWSWAAVEGSVDHLDYEPSAGEPGLVMGGPFPAIPGGDRIKSSVFNTKPSFVRVRPAAKPPMAGGAGVQDAYSWSDDTVCGPDVLHMPACELRMWGRLVGAVFSDEQVNVRKWRPRSNWRPTSQVPHAADAMFNGYKPVFERALGVYSFGFYLTGKGDSGKKFGIGRFDVKDETCSDVWCLQLTEVEGLMLREVEHSNGIRKFQRAGIFWLEDQHWFDDVDEVEICLV